MKLTPGEIYFIGEKDLKTGLDTSYCKIGIVRDGAAMSLVGTGLRWAPDKFLPQLERYLREGDE
jgi:hypothetical protein